MSPGTELTVLGGRLAERGRARRRTRLLVTASVAVLLGLAGLAGWLLLGTGVLGVGQVQVTGTALLDPAQVRSVAAIEAGTPLAALDTASVATRLGKLPAVRAVEVDRRWPHTVEIRVHERQPAAVQARGPAYVLVDRSGVAFAPVDRRPAGLPLVSAPFGADAPALRAALDVLEQMSAPLRGQVREVRATSVEDVALRLSRDRTVLWGSADRSARKAAVLTVLLSRKARIYDVSAPDAPTTRR